MTETKLTDTERGAVEEFFRSHPNGNYLQSAMWAKVKPDWVSETIASFGADGSVRGAMLCLMRKIPMMPYTLMYAPRGPICDYDDEETLRDLTEKVKEVAKRHRTYLLKLDPAVLSEDTAFARRMESLGYSLKSHKGFAVGLQPQHVMRLDIEGKTEDEVFMSFSQKTRYNIRVALKHGVEVGVGTADDLPRFQEIMNVTGARDGFIVRSLPYFQRMFRVLGDHIRLYTAKYNGEMIAGAVAIAYGDKVWYSYGASANEFRDVMPNYLLQWEMIRWAVSRGARIYDFRGIPSKDEENSPLYGLYRFKKGFNPTYCEFIGELNFTFKPLPARAINAASSAFFKLRGLVMKRKK